LLGSAGVVVLLSGQEAAFGAGQLWGVLFSLGAAVLFALGAVLNRSPLPIPFVVSTAWQVGLGCVPLALLGLAFEHPHFSALTSAGAWIMIYMALVAMGVCYLTWFATLRFLPATTAATGMLSVPVFGVLSAAIMLGESFGIREVVALALTLSGVALALRS
jgi:drug/metabolite transporter (DMT)-like permease